MIGIDVGGANLKVVDRSGAHIHYCPLWTEAPLAGMLGGYAGEGENAAVVMSGELADSFSSKAEGIAFIVDAVREHFPDAIFYGIDGLFHDRAVPELAAANWLASADYLRGRYPDAVLLDVGSTTADIVPLGRFDDLLGLTDLLRLQQGYLVYTGMLRTNVATILRAVEINGIFTPVSTEYFACSGDAHLVLGTIQPEDYTSATPDGGQATVDAALRRLQRAGPGGRADQRQRRPGGLPPRGRRGRRRRARGHAPGGRRGRDPAPRQPGQGLDPCVRGAGPGDSAQGQGNQDSSPRRRPETLNLRPAWPMSSGGGRPAHLDGGKHTG